MEISINKETLDTTGNPHKALELMRADLTKQIEQLGHKYEWYIVTSTNDNGGLKMTAEFSEELKQFYEANPL